MLLKGFESPIVEVLVRIQGEPLFKEKVTQWLETSVFFYIW